MRAVRVRASPPRHLTLAAWAALDDEVRGELVDGVLEEEELPTIIHDVVVIWLIHALAGWAFRRGGVVLGSESKYAVGRKTGRKPDVSLFLKGQLPKKNVSLIHTAPWVAVEVVSPRPRDQRRDRVAKVREYAQAGFRYYWMVDPAMRTLEILELDRGRYAHALSATEGTVRSVPGCPGLTLRLGQLWKQIAEYE